MSLQTPTVIDLFAGVGGLSLGAARAGFRLASAVEIDVRAREAHAQNFPGMAHIGEDVALLSGARLLSLSGVKPNSLGGLIGGPPCQGFSEIGLRSASDPRNDLLGHFCRLVRETRPAFFLAENVPGLLHPRNAEVLAAAFRRIPTDYIRLAPITVKASDYGAPTIRTRVFFIGFDPQKIDSVDAGDFAAKTLEDVRVRDALRGLPTIRSDWQTEKQSWRVIEDAGDSLYAKRLSGFIPAGVGDAVALKRYREKRLVSGFLGTAHSAETVRRFRSLKQGKVDQISKSVRLVPDGYCPTLRAGTGPERGSYQAIRPIHPTSHRVISPREAARLQGFPDWFQFHPTKWHAFRQIGNSVSPIVAEAIFSTLAHAMCRNSAPLIKV